MERLLGSRDGLQDRRYSVATAKQKRKAQPTIDNPLKKYDDGLINPRPNLTELERYVQQFAEQSDLGDQFDLLVKGARLARDHQAAVTRYSDVFSGPELELLDEKNELSRGFWKQSKFFRATIVAASLGAMINGWTQSANNGTAYGMPKDFGLHVTKSGPDDVPPVSHLWMFGMLMAIPWLSAGVFGTFLADPLQENLLGRRGSIMLSCVITIASTIGASATHSVAQLAICRMLNGIALGAKASIIPIYSAEICPSHIRGAVLANWQLADAAGIFVGCLANLLVVHFAEEGWRSWRILTNTVMILTIPLLIMIYLMPESPRYLMKHGKYRQALESFSQLQVTPLLASRDFILTHAQLNLEGRVLNEMSGNVAGPSKWSQHSSNTAVSSNSVSQERTSPIEMAALDNIVPPHENLQQQSDGYESSRPVGASVQSETVGGSKELDLERALRQLRARNNPYSYHIGVAGYFSRLAQLWRVKRCRRALVCATVAMSSQILTGVNVIAMLGTIVWEDLLLPPPSEPPIKVATNERYNAKIAAILGLAFGAANYIGGLPAYWLSDRIGRSIMLAMGLPNMAWSMLVLALLFQIDESTLRTPLVAVFAVIFVLFYAPSAGTSPFSIAAEVFPLVTREAGMAVAVAVNLLGAGMLVLVFPFVLSKVRATSALSIFAVLNLVAFVLVYLLCPETKMRKLEELQETFDLPTRWHVEYRAVYVQKHVRKNAWRYLRGQEVDPPLPFYRWAEIFHTQES